MKNKVLLPVVAIMFAIGLSFATENIEIDPTQDYYQESSGVFMPLGREIDCVNNNDSCWVELPNGEVHEIYDAPSPDSKKIGDGTVYEL